MPRRKPVFRPALMDFHPRWHGGAPGISLNSKVGSHFRPSQPTNPESRVSPEYGFARRRMIGSTRTSMVGNVAKRRFGVGGAQKARRGLSKQIAAGTRAMPRDDFMAGGPVHARHGCTGRACELLTAASTAKPSGKFKGRYRGHMLPVGARSLSNVSARARREFGAQRERGGLGNIDEAIETLSQLKMQRIRCREIIKDIVARAQREQRGLTVAETREIQRRLATMKVR